MKKELFVLAAVLIASSFASAAFSDAYDDKTGLTVDYTGIGESNAGDYALFGAPQISGDLLYFTATNFSVLSNDGDGLDQKDGHLYLTLDAHGGSDIDSVELEEYGDFGLADFIGNGTSTTMAQVIALAQIDILEVDGVSLGANFVHANGNAVYKPVSPVTEGKFDLINHGPDTYDPDEMLWEAEVKFDIKAILADAGYAPNQGATLVNFYLDNKLYAYSEAGTLAEIAKKGSYIIGITVPEPATMALLGLGGLLLRRKK